ncbi:MAG: DNA mismatch repair protein MutS, partial [Novosphingobium sp.]
MARAPRGLSAEEAELWNRVAATITPLHPPRPNAKQVVAAVTTAPTPPLPVRRVKGRVPPPPAPPPPPRPVARPLESHGLDSSWDRKLSRGAIAPDVTIDLHGLGLDAAHGRLNGGIAQALAMGARVMLLIAG